MSTTIDMAYNSNRADIRLPEYGRTIQGMLEYAKGIADPMARQKTVEAIIVLMQQINPTNKNLDDYKEKLWNHAFRIANYELDVTPPQGVTIRRESDRPKPEPVPYPKATTRFRHYGQSVQTLMKKAIEMPDGPKKEGFVEVIASYMKLAYKTWNKEHYVSDEVVKDDLEILSNGKLILHEGHNSLDTLAYSAIQKEKEQKRQRSGRRKGGGNNSNSGNNSNNNGGGGRKRNFGSGYKKHRK